MSRLGLNLLTSRRWCILQGVEAMQEFRHAGKFQLAQAQAEYANNTKLLKMTPFMLQITARQLGITFSDLVLRVENERIRRRLAGEGNCEVVE